MPDNKEPHCDKSSVLDQIQRDIREIKKSNGEIREKIFNGLSTAVPKIEKNIEALKKDVMALAVRSAETEPSLKKAGTRFLGSAVIGLSVGGAFFGLLFLFVATGLIDMEGLGRLIAALLGGIG